MTVLTKSTLLDFIRGEETAFTQVYQLYYNDIYRYCVKHTRAKELAEELTSDVFLRLWEARKQLDPDRDLKPYLLTITKNVTFTWLKRTVSDQKMKSEFRSRYLLAQGDARHDEVIAASMDLSRLRQMISTLPLKRRRTFELCKLDGMTYAEAASVLSVSRETIKEHMTLAQRDISKLAKPSDFLYLLFPFVLSLNNFF